MQRDRVYSPSTSTARLHIYRVDSPIRTRCRRNLSIMKKSSAPGGKVEACYQGQCNSCLCVAQLVCDADMTNYCALFLKLLECVKYLARQGLHSAFVMKEVFPSMGTSTSGMCCNLNIVHLWACHRESESTSHLQLSMRSS